MQRIMIRSLLALLTLLLPMAAFASSTGGASSQNELQSLLNPIDLNVELVFLARMLIAFILGAVSGITHDSHRIGIGLKTFGAVALGSSIFASIGLHLFFAYSSEYALTIAAGVVTGIGFLSGAVIFKEQLAIRGLSSAATLWATAAVGLATGMGMYIIAIGGAIIICAFHLYARCHPSVD